MEMLTGAAALKRRARRWTSHTLDAAPILFLALAVIGAAIEQHEAAPGSPSAPSSSR